MWAPPPGAQRPAPVGPPVLVCRALREGSLTKTHDALTDSRKVLLIRFSLWDFLKSLTIKLFITELNGISEQKTLTLRGRIISDLVVLLFSFKILALRNIFRQF